MKGVKRTPLPDFYISAQAAVLNLRLFWQRADMKWHKYGPLDSSRSFAELVAGIDADTHGCFFG